MSNNMTLFPLLPLQINDSNLKKQPCFTVLLVILVLLTQRYFWSKPHQMKRSSLPPQQVKIAVTEEERTTATVVDETPDEVVETGLTTSVVVGANNNSNNGSNGSALGNSGLSGTFHHILTHPTIGVGRTNNNPNSQQGVVLGPIPQKVVFNVNTPSPTNIENAIRTLNLTQPDPSWYTDTGAISHMTSSLGV
jgi:hypothetical protein